MSDTELPIGFADVESAAERLAGIAVRTPLLESRALNERVGGRLLVKPEMLQLTGSFKFRGAYNRISRLSEAERRRGVIAYSSGNHAQGVAAAARLCGAPAVIVMPDDAPAVKRAGTEAWGAEVIGYDRRGGESREERAEAIAAKRGLTLVRPYDDPFVMAGQGTVGLELAVQAQELGVRLDAVLVPCGGGGLTSGVATALHALSPSTRVHPVEPAGYDDTARSLAAGKRQANDMTADSLCDSLLSPAPGELAFRVIRALCAEGLVVSDDEALDAMAQAFTYLKLVAEPGGAVSLAAALAGRIDLQGRTAGIVISGGNVDAAVYARALAPLMRA